VSATASAAALTLAEAFDHEQLELFRDRRTGLTGVVAIHSTALGPATGGLRIRRYRDLQAASVDALRLSAAMTLKNSAAGLDLGGGKAVLIDDGRWDEDRAGRMHAFGDVLERLGGRYITAEDVGTTAADMDAIATRTDHVSGRSPANGGRGDPARATARTVFGAIQTAVAFRLGRPLDGVTVGVLGAGQVGSELVGLLAAAGAEVLVADIDAGRAERCRTASGAVTALPVDGFQDRPMDVFAPCALGEIIDAEDVSSLRCGIIAGAANNPLVDSAVAPVLEAEGILYVPDFIANCGGIVHVAAEVYGHDDDWVEARIAACIARVGEVLKDASDEGALPIEIARRRALSRVERARPAA
jgi:leucine dehydrogenase